MLPHKILMKMDEFPADEIAWCEETLGKHDKGWAMVWVNPAYREFHFRTEKDLLMFALKWVK